MQLYINRQLIDLPPDFTVRIDRIFLSPTELNYKDAQYSYSVSLPATPNNVRAFKFVNIEETRNKFDGNFEAELIAGGVRIFKGYFRISSLKKTINGNLYIPAKKSVTDIFGDKILNQNPDYYIDFTDFNYSVSYYNSLVNPVAIFPLALYGVIPKIPIDKTADVYSAKNLWDSSARLGMQDVPPSVNVLNVLKHIFESNGYSLQGSAFSDPKLTGLYLSYKNPNSYIQPWNYGYNGKIKISGEWSNYQDKKTGAYAKYERGLITGDEGIYSCDLFDATNTKINVDLDTGGNIIYRERIDDNARTWVNCQVRIPVSGLYKVKLKASFKVDNTPNFRVTDPVTNIQFLSGYSDLETNDFTDNIYEFRLVRDRNEGDFGISKNKLNGTFYKDNAPQNDVFSENNIPKYFPQVSTDGQINFIDLMQDQNLIAGFAIGGQIDKMELHNPKDLTDKNVQITVAKPAVSWNLSENSGKSNLLALQNSGWWKYGRIGSFDSEGENPTENIDYSGGSYVLGKQLDTNGNPVTPAGGNLNNRTAGYYISYANGNLYPDGDFLVSDFIDLAAFTVTGFSGNTHNTPAVAVYAFYDIDQIFIGVALQATNNIYTDEPITIPPLAAYIRFTEHYDHPITINAYSVVTGFVILHRFTLQKWYTYLLQAPSGSNYEGFAYLHNGTDVVPLQIVEFMGGIAEINTSVITTDEFNPVLTLYLATDAFDVDGTLTITRKINPDSKNVIDWELTNKYAITLNNSPANFIKRGQFDGVTGDDLKEAEGNFNAVVWLEAGELVSLASVSSEGGYRRSGMHTTFGTVIHELKFDLEITPFRIEKDWVKVNKRGNGFAPMDWNDPINFDVESINLIKFLPSEIKTDDFITNFCKAFNLILSNTEGNIFSLDVKPAYLNSSTVFVDLDPYANVAEIESNPLEIPLEYKLGFTVDTEEEGYFLTQNDGGGQYLTGAILGETVEQKSFFSFNWFKSITKSETGGNITLQLPVISKHSSFEDGTTYPDAMQAKSTDLPLRFWYQDGILAGSFNFGGSAIQLAKVSGELGALSILDYKNKKASILRNYFKIFVNSASNYSEIEVYLTPVQYAKLNGVALVRLNGDLYQVAEITGYDPTGKNKTKIKLIRK